MIDAEEVAEEITKFLGRTQYDPGGYEPHDFIVWHTHPGGLVGPSKGDMEARQGSAVDFRYIVLSLPDGVVTEY